MNTLETVLTQPWAEALSWALLHFIWQGTLVAGLLAGVLLLLRQEAANARYLAACGALALMLALPVVTTTWNVASADSGTGGRELPDAVSPWPQLEGAAGVSGQPHAVLSPNWLPQEIGRRLAGWLPYLTALWLSGVLLCSLRLAGGWWLVRRLSRAALPVAEQWSKKVQLIAASLGITKPVRLLASALVQVPTAIGWLRPVILVPTSALTGLAPQQLEAILAHELAHIRRHDYLVNLLQRVVETLLFYHPAVWWVSRQARIEREHCCDDLAVAVCGDRLAYARALAEMEGLRAAPQLALAASGGLLVNRIRRLLGIAETDGRSGKLAACVVILVMMIAVITVTGSSSTTHFAARQRFGQEKAARPAVEASPSDPARPVREASATREEAEPLRPTGQQVQASLRTLLSGQDIESLLAALNDEDFQVRDNAIAELGKLGDRRAVEPLIALLKDPNVYIRDNAINSLGFIGDRRAVGPLLEALTDANVYIRDNAITALGRLRDPRAVAPLIALLGDRNVYLRDNAAVALGEIGDRRAVEPLRAALNDENWYVRQTAAKSLARLSGN